MSFDIDREEAAKQAHMTRHLSWRLNPHGIMYARDHVRLGPGQVET